MKITRIDRIELKVTHDVRWVEAYKFGGSLRDDIRYLIRRVRRAEKSKRRAA